MTHAGFKRAVAMRRSPAAVRAPGGRHARIAVRDRPVPYLSWALALRAVVLRQPACVRPGWQHRNSRPRKGLDRKPPSRQAAKPPSHQAAACLASAMQGAVRAVPGEGGGDCGAGGLCLGAEGNRSWRRAAHRAACTALGARRWRGHRCTCRPRTPRSAAGVGTGQALRRCAGQTVVVATAAATAAMPTQGSQRGPAVARKAARRLALMFSRSPSCTPSAQDMCRKRRYGTARHTQPSRVRHTQPSRVRHTQPSRVRHTQPSRVRHTQPSRVRHTQPSRVRHTQPSRVRHTQPSRVRHTQPSRVRHTQPSRVRPHPPSQIPSTRHALLAVRAERGVTWAHEVLQAVLGIVRLRRPARRAGGGRSMPHTADAQRRPCPKAPIAS
jgi:hypothetical protein